MMPGSEKVDSQERLDQIELKLLRSLKVSDEEIEAAAASPDLYDRLRLRIKAGPRQLRGQEVFAERRLTRIGKGLPFIPIQSRMVLWTLAAAAAVLLLGASLWVWRPRTSAEPSRLTESVSPQTPSAPQREIERSVPPDKPESKGKPILKRVASRDRSLATSRRSRARNRSSEVATDFFPLTFIADATALESGQVVRVRIPRSALVTFGVPMNVERAGELVKADVVIGDDGLARAIRFIQ